MFASKTERHRTQRIGWLRAAVLGANDGILSTSSLVLGVAAAHANHRSELIAGVAALVAGAMSMAAGEYVSVHSQADTEQADLKLERAELKADDQGEHRELTAIYVGRGLEPLLAKQVAEQLMTHDALGAHARDELASPRRFVRVRFRQHGHRLAALPSARPCPSWLLRWLRRLCLYLLWQRLPCYSSRCSGHWPLTRAEQESSWAQSA